MLWCLRINNYLKMAHPTRIFKTDKELEKVWTRYKENLKEKAKQWEKIQYVGKDGYKVTDYPKLPLTLEGLKRFSSMKR